MTRLDLTDDEKRALIRCLKRAINGDQPRHALPLRAILARLEPPTPPLRRRGSRFLRAKYRSEGQRLLALMAQQLSAPFDVRPIEAYEGFPADRGVYRHVDRAKRRDVYAGSAVRGGFRSRMRAHLRRGERNRIVHEGYRFADIDVHFQPLDEWKNSEILAYEALLIAAIGTRREGSGPLINRSGVRGEGLLES
jgi:hypothetical protein